MKIISFFKSHKRYIASPKSLNAAFGKSTIIRVTVGKGSKITVKSAKVEKPYGALHALCELCG